MMVSGTLILSPARPTADFDRQKPRGISDCDHIWHVIDAHHRAIAHLPALTVMATLLQLASLLMAGLAGNLLSILTLPRQPGTMKPMASCQPDHDHLMFCQMLFRR